MKLNPEEFTQAAQQAYALGRKYYRASDAYKVYKDTNVYPETPHEPTPEEYNEWQEKNKRYHDLDNTLRAPVAEAKKAYRDASRNLHDLMPDLPSRMKVRLEEGEFVVFISWYDGGPQAQFVAVEKESDDA